MKEAVGIKSKSNPSNCLFIQMHKYWFGANSKLVAATIQHSLEVKEAKSILLR